MLKVTNLNGSEMKKAIKGSIKISNLINKHNKILSMVPKETKKNQKQKRKKQTTTLQTAS